MSKGFSGLSVFSNDSFVPLGMSCKVCISIWASGEFLGNDKYNVFCVVNINVMSFSLIFKSSYFPIASSHG